MEIITNLDTIKSWKKPVILTIGNFDGLHLGHQKIMQRVTQLAEQHQTNSAVITFENHPALLLKPEQPVELICSQEHKKHLLDHMGIHLLLLLKFTQAFANQTARDFLINIQNRLPFSHLISGYDAAFGKDRQGKPEQILELSKQLNFCVEHLPLIQVEKKTVTSSNIRQLIHQGKLAEVEQFLGRKFSIYGKLLPGTLTLPTKGLCLPPLGIYAAEVACNGQMQQETTVTLRQDFLEIHLSNAHFFERSDQTVEVILQDKVSIKP